MKKLLIVPFVLCLFFFTSRAQMTAGVKGGVSWTHLSGFDENDRVSGHLGFFLHRTINRNWCFQPELLYSGEGQRYFTDGEERTIALGYIQLPLVIQYYPARQLYFEAGPQVGLLASAKDKGNDGEFNIKEDFTTAQVGLNLGVGVKANNTIGFYGRYTFGLTDVTKFDSFIDQSRVGQLGMTIRLR